MILENNIHDHLYKNIDDTRLTIFGQISPLWQNFKSFAILKYLAKNHILLLQIVYAFGQIFIAVNGQTLNK